MMEDHATTTRRLAGGWWSWVCIGSGCGATGTRYPTRGEAMRGGIAHERGELHPWEPIGA